MSRRLALLRLSSVAAVAALFGFTGSADAALTIDLRLLDGGKNAAPVGGGTKFLVDVWATVSGTSTDLANSYGLSSVNGSIVSQGEALINIAVATVSVAWTMIGASTLGRM